MADIQEITKDNFDSDVLSATGMQMVYYYAPWCKPCQEMEEIVDITADEVSEKMDIVKVNTDQEHEIVQQQKIRVLPTYQIFNAGKLIDTLRGPLSKLELLGELSHLISQEEPEDKAESSPDKPEA